MAFTPEAPKIPAAIGDIAVVLVDHDGIEPDEVQYEVQILQSDGSIFRVAYGNLKPHLTSQQIEGLQSFMADMRILAQQLLP